MERFTEQWRNRQMESSKVELVDLVEKTGRRNIELTEMNFNIRAQQRHEHEVLKKCLKDLCAGKWKDAAAKIYEIVDPYEDEIEEMKVQN